MEIRAVTPSPVSTEPKPTMPRVKPEGQGLTPSDVPLLTADRLSIEELSASGQTLAEIPFADSPESALAPQVVPPSQVFDFQDVMPRMVEPKEIEQVLEVYHQKVRERLENASDNSLLDQFETSVRLMAQLRNPELRHQDRQAWDILHLRKGQIEREYERLIQTPEIRQTFDEARTEALQEVFTDRQMRAQQQAAYLLSDSFQEELYALEPQAIQAKVQQELSALSIMSPRLAEGISEDLLEKTLRFQAIRLIQAEDEAGEAARTTLGDALAVYLRTQQSATRVGMQVNNLAILANLSDEKILQLTQAVANLAQGTQASTPQQLAQVLVNRVDQLPTELQPSANVLLTRMQTQNILGTVLLAGSVTSLLQQDLPHDPEMWAGLTASSLATASMSHFALRLAGLGQAAEWASQINYTAELGQVKIPILFSAVVGINTALDAVAMAREMQNEDLVGTTARAVGVGSGVATLAALTVLSGPAAPITLIGSSVVGLAAWGIESVYGESDVSGQVRRDLRQIGILDQEEALIESYRPSPNDRGWELLGSALPEKERLQQAPIAEQVQVINQLLDGWTSDDAEALIHEILMGASDEDFMGLMRQLNVRRLAEELEQAEQLLPVMERVLMQENIAESARLVEGMMGRLALGSRYDEIQALWPKLPDSLKNQFSVDGLAQISRSVKDRWFPGQTARQLLVQILSDPALERQSVALLARRNDQHLLELQKNLSVPEMAELLTHLSRSADPESQALLERLYTLPELPGADDYPNLSLTRLGSNLSTAYLTSLMLQDLTQDELQKLTPTLRQQMQSLLQTAGQELPMQHPLMGAQLQRLMSL